MFLSVMRLATRLSKKERVAKDSVQSCGLGGEWSATLRAFAMACFTERYGKFQERTPKQGWTRDALGSTDTGAWLTGFC